MNFYYIRNSESLPHLHRNRHRVAFVLAEMIKVWSLVVHELKEAMLERWAAIMSYSVRKLQCKLDACCERIRPE